MVYTQSADFKMEALQLLSSVVEADQPNAQTNLMKAQTLATLEVAKQLSLILKNCMT